MQNLPLFWITWSKTPSTTRHHKEFSDRTIWIWLAIALQSAFAYTILCKSYDGERSGRVKLVRISLRTPIVNILFIEAWSGVLIFAISISVSTMTICLIRGYFSIFLYKYTVFKVKSSIISGYIVACGEAVERLTSSRKSISELLLSSALRK